MIKDKYYVNVGHVLESEPGYNMLSIDRQAELMVGLAHALEEIEREAGVRLNIVAPKDSSINCPYCHEDHGSDDGGLQPMQKEYEFNDDSEGHFMEIRLFCRCCKHAFSGRLAPECTEDQ